MTNLFAEHEDFIRTFIPKRANNEPILVDITNVAYWVQNQEKDSFHKSEWVLNLPWKTTWFEYKLPNTITVNGEKLTNRNPDNNIVGILAMYDDKTDYNTYQMFMSWEGSFEDALYDWKEPDGIRYCGGLNKSIDGKDDGKVIIGPYLTKEANSGRMTQDLTKSFVSNEINNALFASTFAHCKNVSYYEKSHPEKLQKANIKRGKIPQETYRILDIDGLQKQSKSEATGSEGELKRALHICRGHFKTYTKDNPLFGKVTGTFWCPMHKRGSKENGEVKKDYSISPSV